MVAELDYEGSLRPLMYGYLRVDLAERDGQIDEWDKQIELFASNEGFDLGMVFHDPDIKGGGFAALIEELQRAESRHVVVPSMAHVIGQGAMSRQALVARLWAEAGAGVWVATPESNRIEVRVDERRAAWGLAGPRHEGV